MLFYTVKCFLKKIIFKMYLSNKKKFYCNPTATLQKNEMMKTTL